MSGRIGNGGMLERGDCIIWMLTKDGAERVFDAVARSPLQHCARRAVLVGLLASGTVEAQTERGAQLHDGGYLRLAIGGGRLQDSFTASGSGTFGEMREGTVSGPSIAVEITAGATPIPGWVLAAGATAERATISSSELITDDPDRSYPPSVESCTLRALILVTSVYPDPREGFHALVGAGWGTLGIGESIRSRDIRNHGQSSTGYFFFAGIGYDAWTSDQWSLGVLARAGYGRFSGPETEWPNPTGERPDGERDHRVLMAPTLLVTFTNH